MEQYEASHRFYGCSNGLRRCVSDSTCRWMIDRNGVENETPDVANEGTAYSQARESSRCVLDTNSPSGVRGGETKMTAIGEFRGKAKAP